MIRPFSLTILISALALCVVGTGCKTYRTQAKGMREAWVEGRYEEAAEDFSKRALKKDDGKDGVVWNLEAGTVLRAVGEFEQSNFYFDEAAQQIDEYEQKARVRVSREAAATMSNQQSLPYTGRSYDKIMLHTYKALNYLALGEIDKARPELIRAYQRQQDAVNENARRIEKAREEEEESAQRVQVERAKNDSVFMHELNQSTGNLEGFTVYADYVNPFTVFMDGLYFMYAGAGSSDRERAIKSLNRVIEVTGENSVIRADLEQLANPNGFDANEPVTYVILETGRAASRDQIRIDVPIIITDVSYVGAAFPKLEFHEDYLPRLIVKADHVDGTTETVASMDSIITLDFKNEWPVILTKTLISTAAKGASAYAVNRAAGSQSDLGGVLARIGTAVYQAAVNIADTRTWSTLPKEFQVARLPTPADRTLTLSSGTGRREDVALVDGIVNVVFVRSVTSTSPLLINQFKLR